MLATHVLPPRPFQPPECYHLLGHRRRVLGYYGGYGGDSAEDAFDMRKALARDVKKTSVIPLRRPIKPEDLYNSGTVHLG